MLPKFCPAQAFIVAVPLGNAQDLSFRSAALLASVDRIFCEDTRKTQALLERAGIKAKGRLTPLPGDSEFEAPWEKWAQEDEGKTWLFCSDAGSPIISDPGAAFVKFCARLKIPLVAVPGPAAPILAWQWSGGFGLPFTFGGFPPKEKNVEAKPLQDFFDQAIGSGTFCFFESRHHVLSSLEHLIQRGWGNKKIYLAREMTKTHEELLGGTVQELFERIKIILAKEGGLGELTFLLQGEKRESSAQTIDVSTLLSLRLLPPKKAAKVMAQICGLSTHEVYGQMVKEKHED